MTETDEGGVGNLRRLPPRANLSCHTRTVGCRSVCQLRSRLVRVFRRRARRNLFGTVLGTLLVPGVAAGHLGDRVYPIFELPSSDLPDLHDGTLEDWEAVLVPSLDQPDFLSRIRNGNEGGLEALEQHEIALEVYLAWHYASQRIFVGVYRFDAYYRSRLPPEPPPADFDHADTDCCGYYDHVEVFVDGDHGGEQSTAFSGTANQKAVIDNVKSQAYQVVPEAEGDRRIRLYGYGPVWALDPPYSDAGGFRVGESPSLSGYEIAVTPWDALQADPAGSVRSKLEPDRIVGFCVGIWDMDDFFNWSEWLQRPTLPNPWSLYSSSGCRLHFGDQFVDGLLIPCTAGDCSGGTSSPGSSAVRVDSWGRIKAAFAR